MIKKIWLIFAQATAVGVGLWLVFSLVKPQWFQRGVVSPVQKVVTISEVPSGSVAQPVVLQSFRDAAKNAMPAMVNIYTTKAVSPDRHPMMNDPLFKRFFGNKARGQQQASSLGSGVIVSQDGYVITNNHVIEAADQIEVALSDGKHFPALIVGTDPETDLAVLKLPSQNFKSIDFGKSDQLQVGDVVLAMGNPFGVGQTVTMGIVSALGRNHLGINTFENFIQTDAPINPGNSGGALVDARGALVGINSAIYSKSGGSQGIGFAIPESTVRMVLEQIIRNGGVIRGWVGVAAQDVTPEIVRKFGLKEARGALVSGVVRGAPADIAGIFPGDVLLSVAGRPIDDANMMLYEIAALAPGQEAKIELLRTGKVISLPILVARRPNIRTQDVDE